MPLKRACVLSFLVAGYAAAQVAAPVPTPYVVPVAGPDEVIVFEKPSYQGDFMRLKVGEALPDLKESPHGNWDLRISSVKVGDEAVAVLFSSVRFRRWCLGLPGKALGGSGYYPDLAKMKSDDLRADMGNKARSMRVLGKDADLASVCKATKEKIELRGRLH